MATLSEVVQECSAEASPVLLLDTCDFLDVIRGISSGTLGQVRSFRRMNDALDLDPKRFRPVVTYLVVHEWERNHPGVEKEVGAFLKETRKRVSRFAQARDQVDLTRLIIQEDVFDPNLVGELAGLAKTLIGRATVVEKDVPCVARALERVMEQQRPSQKTRSRIRSTGSITSNCPGNSRRRATPARGSL